MNSLPRFLQSTAVRTRLARAPVAPAQRRHMGGDMPVPQSSKAELFGEHKVPYEGWEYITYTFYGIAAVLQIAILLGAPETSAESWASAEAKARLKLKAVDPKSQIVFGVHYQDLVDDSSDGLWDKFNLRSVKAGDDDDDDEDDDE